MSRTRDGLGVVGLGATACVACCAGPVLAFLGGLSVAGLAGTAFFGVLALLVAIPAAVAFLVVRRRRTAEATPTAAVPVDAPRRAIRTEV